MSNSDLNTILPPPDAPDSIKNDDRYGVAVAKAIWGANKEYITARNERFYNADLYFKGMQPISPYLNLMNVNGREAFIDINFKPNPIAKKFVKIIMGGYMAKKEKPSATSTNPIVADKKQDKIDNAKWKILQKEFINDVQKQSGMQLEDTGSYLPSYVEEAEFYYGMNPKVREEILLEMMIQFAMDQNDISAIKKRILRDLIVRGIAGVEDGYDASGRLILDPIPSEELIYAPSKKEMISDDAQYVGRYKRMSIADFRNIPGNNLSEADIYKVARSFANQVGNSRMNYPFDPAWQSSISRPYDSNVINVIKFWYKAIKNVNYVEGTDSHGRTVFDFTNAIYEKTNPSKKANSKPIFVGYTGTWVVGTDFIVNWGPESDMLKPDDALQSIEPPITVFMIDNDGTMQQKSIVEDMISSIIEMDLDKLKIQQIKAQQAPNGLLIDIEGLDNIDLGLGQGALKPLKLREIRSQTGDLYWRSKNEPGDPQNPPIKELKGDFGNMLSELIADYNFHLANIRDYIGVNEYREGSSVNPKTGLGVLNQQLENSNTATQFIYDALVAILKRISKHIGQRTMDALKYNSKNGKAYREMLGEANVEFVKGLSDVTASLYDIDIETDLSEKEEAQLEQEIQSAIAAGTIELKDVAALHTMRNKKYAAQYLSMISAKNKAQAAKAAAANAQMNIESQLASIKAKGDSNVQVAATNGASQVKVVEQKTAGSILEKKVDFYNQMRLAAFNLGKELPDDIKQEIAQFNQQESQIQAFGVMTMLNDAQQQEEEKQAAEQQAQQQQQQDPNSANPQDVQTE